jgi:hypothetical protein
LSSDLRALTAIHRVRVAKKARELSERTQAVDAAERAHQQEVSAQEDLLRKSDGAVASLEIGRDGLLSSLEIQFASEFSTASRWAAWDKIETIEKLKAKYQETIVERQAAQQVWRTHDVRRQSIESVADRLFDLQRRMRNELEESTVDEGFLDGFSSRTESQQ